MTLYVAKVYQDLTIGDANRSRNIGWWTSYGAAITGLGHFGAECYYSYAVIEEFTQPGIHPHVTHTTWFKFENSEWHEIDTDQDNTLMQCINHTIG